MGITHNWSATNPVGDPNVKIPSDADAVRIHVPPHAEEMQYFATCKRLAAHLLFEASKAKGRAMWAKQRAAAAFDTLHDVGRLMLLPGPRPSEVMMARVEHVNLAKAEWLIADGKSSYGISPNFGPHARGARDSGAALYDSRN